MEAFADKLFSEYGVLAMGWVFAVFFYVRLMKVSDLLVKMQETTITANLSVAHALTSLKEYLTARRE